MLKPHRFWEGQTHIQNSTLLLSSYGALDKSFPLSGPRFPHLQNGINNSIYLTELLLAYGRIQYMRCFSYYLLWSISLHH